MFKPSNSPRYLVTIEKLTGEQDSTGQELKNWQTFSTAYVSFDSPKGMEMLANHQLYGSLSVVMVGRFPDLQGVTPKMRISLSNEDSPETFRRFDIQAAGDPDGRRIWMRLTCIERVESGYAGE